jgi:hypothetical protein
VEKAIKEMRNKKATGDDVERRRFENNEEIDQHHL